jgi:hypothetical protein
MKIYLVKEHMALQEGSRETVMAAYLDRENAEKDAHGHQESQYTHWMVDELDIKDGRSFLKKLGEKKKPMKATAKHR